MGIFNVPQHVVNSQLNLIVEIYSTIKIVLAAAVISEWKVASNIQLLNSWFPTSHQA